MDFLEHICTFSTDMFCATLKSLLEVLTILAMVQCSSTTMPHCTQHSRLILCCSIFNEKQWAIPHKLKIWYLANFSCFPPSRSNCHIILPVKKGQICYQHVSDTTETSSYPSGMDNLSHSVTSASTIKATMLQNSIPVTPSLCITSFIC